MIDAIKKDMVDLLHEDLSGENCYIDMAYTEDTEAIARFKEEVQAEWPNHEIMVDPLSLSVSCHIGPGSIAVTCTKKVSL